MNELLLKLKKIAPRILVRFYHKLKNEDDFNWSEYNIAYRGEISDITQEHTQLLSDNNFKILEGKIILNQNLKPLHDNHKLLYETILNLKPNSIFEVGYGCGDHLANLNYS